MSLIDEALKRARQEAERREMAQRSAASRWVPSHPLTGRRSRPLLWAGAAVVCLAAGVAVGLTVSTLSNDAASDHERETARRPAVAAAPVVGEKDQVGKGGGALLEDLVTEPPAGEQATAPTEPEVSLLPSQPPIAGGTPPANPPATAGGQRPLSPPSPPPTAAGPRPMRPPVTAGGQPAPSLPSSSSTETSEPQRAPTADQPPPPKGTVHVHRAPLPGGGSIELGGIAFSAAQPVALLNGKVVGVGEVVDGMTVVAIHPRRVDLEGRGVALSVLVE